MSAAALDTVPADLRVSVFRAPVSNTTDHRLVGWDELCRLVQEPLILPDNKAATKAQFGQYFVRGQIAGNRDDENLTLCWLLILDVDKALPGKELPSVHEIHDNLGDMPHIVYTSVTRGRARIIVPVEAYDKSQTGTLTRQLYNHCRSLGLEFAFAGESRTASQPWFYGQCLSEDRFVCLINNDGELFTADPDWVNDDTHADTGTSDTSEKSTGNHLADFIEQLKAGTIHEAAKVYAGWQRRTTTLTTRQIFDDITVLIEKHCSDRDKVQRWHESERAGLEAWFEFNVGNEEQEAEILTAADCQIGEDISLKIPTVVANPGGLISLGMSALSQPGMTGIPQYSLPAVLTTIANAIGGRVVFRGMYANMFNVKVGPTSTGKTESDKAMVQAIRGTGLTAFYGPSDFASGPALFRALVDKPQCMVVIDEGTSLFRRYGKADMVADGKRDALLEVFSKSGEIIEKVYSDKRNNICIENPCLSLTANATTQIFATIENQDFTTGLMQRFDFWCYDGPAPKRGRPGDTHYALANFANGILAIRSALPGADPLHNLAGLISGPPISLDIAEDADNRLQEWSDTVVDRVNAVDDDGLRGIISRSYDLAIKYAMVHVAATRTGKEIIEPLTVKDIEYGITVAWMLADWKITTLRGRVTCGDFDRDSELFKEAIRRVVSRGRRPTFKALVERCRQLKNFPSNYRDQIVKSLTERGEVEVDTSKRATAYQLVKL
jgi:energy-converting hydrogenase A subunit M